MLPVILSINGQRPVCPKLGRMKTNRCAWRAYQVRIWAGLGIILILALGAFGKVFRFDRDDARAGSSAGFAPGMRELADCVAAR